MAEFLLSKSKLIEEYNKLKNLNVIVSYSHKTNEEVGMLLEKLTDSKFNIHSLNSLKQIKDKNRVWYFPFAHSKKEIIELLNNNIDKFVIDNENDLNNLIECINETNKKIQLLIRMKLKENTVKTGKYFVFGLNTKKVNELIEKHSNNSLIEKIGIHVHRKTQNVAEWSLVEDIANSLTKENFKKIEIINIGGGIPSTYKNTNTRTIERIKNKIKELVEYCKKENSAIQIHIEPGRALAAPCVKLKAQIIAIEERNITIDCSVYNTSIDTLIADMKLIVQNEIENYKSEEQYLIKGKTPCSMDIFRYRIGLNNPKKGNYIIFENAGAYNYASDFCNLEKIKTIIVD